MKIRNVDNRLLHFEDEECLERGVTFYGDINRTPTEDAPVELSVYAARYYGEEPVVLSRDDAREIAEFLLRYADTGKLTAQ